MKLLRKGGRSRVGPTRYSMRRPAKKERPATRSFRGQGLATGCVSRTVQTSELQVRFRQLALLRVQHGDARLCGPTSRWVCVFDLNPSYTHHRARSSSTKPTPGSPHAHRHKHIKSNELRRYEQTYYSNFFNREPEDQGFARSHTGTSLHLREPSENAAETLAAARSPDRNGTVLARPAATRRRLRAGQDRPVVVGGGAAIATRRLPGWSSWAHAAGGSRRRRRRSRRPRLRCPRPARTDRRSRGS